MSFNVSLKTKYSNEKTIVKMERSGKYNVLGKIIEPSSGLLTLLIGSCSSSSWLEFFGLPSRSSSGLSLSTLNIRKTKTSMNEDQPGSTLSYLHLQKDLLCHSFFFVSFFFLNIWFWLNILFLRTFS